MPVHSGNPWAVRAPASPRRNSRAKRWDGWTEGFGEGLPRLAIWYGMPGSSLWPRWIGALIKRPRGGKGMSVASAGSQRGWRVRREHNQNALEVVLIGRT